MPIATSLRILICLSLVWAVACTKKEPVKPVAELTPAELVVRGRKIFLANCASCHGANPKENGTVGPAIAGSSLELITARVLRAEYPPGYTPKRKTGAMVALPHLKDDLPAIYAYLDSEK